MAWALAGLTDVGRKREHNEDSLLVAPALNLVAVADGMGGHAAGEVASSLAVEQLQQFFTGFSPDTEKTLPPGSDPSASPFGNYLLDALDEANRRIRHEAESGGRLGMGTTCVAALLEPARATIAWIGDSRAYLFHAGGVTQLTEDHSLLNELLKTGRLSQADVPGFQHTNVITRALGVAETLNAEFVDQAFEHGDVLLLCSDGLNGMLEDEQIAQVLGSEPQLERAGQLLIDAANAAGGEDNITVVLAQWHDGSPGDISG